MKKIIQPILILILFTLLLFYKNIFLPNEIFDHNKRVKEEEELNTKISKIQENLDLIYEQGYNNPYINSLIENEINKIDLSISSTPSQLNRLKKNLIKNFRLTKKLKEENSRYKELLEVREKIYAYQKETNKDKITILNLDYDYVLKTMKIQKKLSKSFIKNNLPNYILTTDDADYYEIKTPEIKNSLFILQNRTNRLTIFLYYRHSLKPYIIFSDTRLKTRNQQHRKHSRIFHDGSIEITTLSPQYKNHIENISLKLLDN